MILNHLSSDGAASEAIVLSGNDRLPSRQADRPIVEACIDSVGAAAVAEIDSEH